jgi:hypothetical protein
MPLQYRSGFGLLFRRFLITQNSLHNRTTQDKWLVRRRRLYLHRTTQHINKRDKHPRLERDSKPGSQQASSRRHIFFIWSYFTLCEKFEIPYQSRDKVAERWMTPLCDHSSIYVFWENTFMVMSSHLRYFHLYHSCNLMWYPHHM